MRRDYYEILGVAKDASNSQIKKAYRNLARKWHPDINPGSKAAEKRFKDISMAYEVLGKPERRKLYDEFGEEGLQSGFDADKAREYEKWKAYQKEKSRGSELREDFQGYQSYQNIFDDIFFGENDFRGFADSRPAKGRDLEHEIFIDLPSALRGFETQLAVQKENVCSHCRGGAVNPAMQESLCLSCGGAGRVNISEKKGYAARVCSQCGGKGKIGSPCPECRGKGSRSFTKRIRVSIPRGVKEGFRVRVAGEGENGALGGPPGDLYLLVHIRPHPFLRRDNDDLRLEVPVTVKEALAGGKIKIPTIDGTVNLTIPPRSQSGQILKLKGKGAFNPKTRETGDLLVKLVVTVPRTDNEKALEAAEKLDAFYQQDIRKNLSF